MKFSEVVEDLKEREGVDRVLFLRRTEAVLMALCWPRVPLRRTERPGPISAGASDQEKLRWLWSQVAYDVREWAKLADVVLPEARAIAKSLTANGIVYPDGTVHENARKYAESVAAAMLKEVMKRNSKR